MVNNAPKQALSKSRELDISRDRRNQSMKKMPREKARDAALSSEKELRRKLFSCVDLFFMELHTRFKGLNNIYNMFDAIQTPNLIHAVEEVVGQASKETLQCL